MEKILEKLANIFSWRYNYIRKYKQGDDSSGYRIWDKVACDIFL